MWGVEDNFGESLLALFVKAVPLFCVSAVLWTAGGPDPRLPNLVLHHRSAGITDSATTLSFFNPGDQAQTLRFGRLAPRLTGHLPCPIYIFRSLTS